MDTSTKRILIVDDTPENIQVLGSVLPLHRVIGLAAINPAAIHADAHASSRR